MEFVLLAPGPSMSQTLADSFKGQRVGVVNNCYELAPWADFLAANDVKWWIKNPEAKQFAGKRYSANRVDKVERVQGASPSLNSGVLALECAKRLGATTIYLHGFDMHGTHYFGTYTNGLGNTSLSSRRRHHSQYAKWARANASIKVYNCTPGSALKCFPCLEPLSVGSGAMEAGDTSPSMSTRYIASSAAVSPTSASSASRMTRERLMKALRSCRPQSPRAGCVP